MGMATLQRPVSGGIVKWVANLIGNIPLVGGLLSVDQILKLDRWVTHALGNAFKAVEGSAVAWFVQLAHYVDVVGYWSLYWPIALVHEVTHLTTVTIPRAINARTRTLDRRIDVAEAEAKSAAGRAHSVTKYVTAQPNTKVITRVERVAMPHAAEWDWLHKHWKALTAAVIGAAALPGVIDVPHIPSLPVPFGRTIKQIRRRLGRLELLLGAAGAAALVARAIGGITPRCVKSGALGKVARRLCGLSPKALEDILGLLVDLFTFSYICEAVKLMEEAFQFVVPDIAKFLATAEEQFVHCKYDLPANHAVADPALPPTTGLTLNPA